MEGEILHFPRDDGLVKAIPLELLCDRAGLCIVPGCSPECGFVPGFSKIPPDISFSRCITFIHNNHQHFFGRNKCCREIYYDIASLPVFGTLRVNGTRRFILCSFLFTNKRLFMRRPFQGHQSGCHPRTVPIFDHPRKTHDLNLVTLLCNIGCRKSILCYKSLERRLGFCWEPL